MATRLPLRPPAWGRLGAWLLALLPAVVAADYYGPGDPAVSNVLGPVSAWSKSVEGETSTYEQIDTGTVSLTQTALGIAGAVVGSARILSAVQTGGYTGYGHSVSFPSGVAGIPPIEGEFRRIVSHTTLAEAALKTLRVNSLPLLGLTAFAEWLSTTGFEWDDAQQTLVKWATSGSGPSSLGRVYFCDGSNTPVSTHAASCSCSDGHVNGRESPWNSSVCVDDAGNEWQTNSDTARESNCPSGYGWNAGTSRCDALPFKQAVLDSVAIPELAAHPSAYPENILSTIALTGVLGQAYYVPKPFGRWLTDPFGQTSRQVKGSPTTTANPDGSTTTKTPTAKVEYPTAPDGKSNGQVKITPGTEIKTCTGSGSCTTTTVTNNGSSDTVQCDKYPDSLGCAKLGDPGSPVQVETKDKPDVMTPMDIGGAAGCPAPLSASFMGRPVEISYDSVCQFANGIHFVILAVSWVVAGWVMFGSLKG